jgi:acetyl-CoA synthetase
VVFAAGLSAELESSLRSAALRYALPVCGPNGNGIVSVGARAPLWGDSVVLGRPGPVAVVSQSGNLAVNALGTRRGLRLHTVVSCGNQTVLDAADYLLALSEMEGVRVVALYLESEGDGAKLAGAFAACVERDIGIVVLKAGTSPQGAAAAAAHTGSLAGDARVLRSLVAEAGGAWATNPHEMLEVAKALAYGRRSRGGAAIVTCSGGDAAVGADEAARLGVPLPTLGPATVGRLDAVLPPSARAANPLDYTALIFGEVAPTAELVAAIGADESVGTVVVNYDQPAGLDDGARASWEGAIRGVLAGAARLDTPVIVASTLPDLMPPDVADRLVDAGVVPAAGLTEGVLCARALLQPVGGADRLRAVSAAAVSVQPGESLAEHSAKDLLRAAGVPVPAGACVSTVESAVEWAASLRRPVAMKLTAPWLRHKSEAGAVLLDVRGPQAVRSGFERLRSMPGHASTPVLIEAMAQPGVELVVAVRRHGVVPVLVLGLGGVWVELFDDALLIPLPVTPSMVASRIGELRAGALLTGFRGRPAVDLAALGRLCADVAILAVEQELALIELNPVIARPDGVIVVDALIQRAAPAPSRPPC